jgi:hypothetical protein
LKNQDSLLTSLAGLIAKITNPAILSVLFLAFIAWTNSSDNPIRIKWAAVILLFLVALPLVYVYIRFYLKKSLSLRSMDPTRILKFHPVDIVVLCLLFGLPCLVTLAYLKMPVLVICSLWALLICALLVAIINMLYRVSFHLASITVLIIMSVTYWGHFWLWLLVLIPLIGWAKYRIKEHNVIQLVSGVLLAGVITIAGLYIYKLLD